MRTALILISTVIVVAACSGDSTGTSGIASVSVTSAITTINVGEASQFTATARDASGSVVPGAPNWNTSAPAIANVNTSGLVSAFAVGQATISATIGGVTGSLGVNVTPNPAGSAVVFMPGFVFTPFSTTINRGGVVIFDFPAEPHNVIFQNVTGAPADILTTSSRRVSRTFTVAGNFPYDCALHPGMSGVVVVQP
jgi:plastocyanin